jgi:hypothetical protein
LNNIIWAFKLINNSSIRYWLESGALLGLWRSGGEISWDSDVDIGVTQDQVSELEGWLNKLQSQSLSVSSRYYRGLCYGYTIKNLKDPEQLPLNIHIYSFDGSIAWSPQIVNWPFIVEKGLSHRSPRSGLTYRFMTYLQNQSKLRRQGSLHQKIWRWAACFLLWGTLVVIRNRMDRHHWASVWPYSEIYDAYTWEIPSHHFRELSTIDFNGLSIPIPSNTESYLQARYGDWRVPVQDWIYWMDDGCLRPIPPEQIRQVPNF